MKKTFILLFISSLFLVGCESYLDRQPDDMMTSDKIWQKMGSTRQYLFNVYSYLPDEGNLNNAQKLIQTLASDEACTNLQWQESVMWCRETWNGYSEILNEAYTKQYAGIHEASVFLENVDRCPELSDSEKLAWKAEARFLRAYFYYQIIQNFGPAFFNGETSTDCLDDDIYTIDRTPWPVFIDFINKELDEAFNYLPEEYEVKSFYGRVTKGAALALKARVALLNARPLFNGQNGTGIYDNIYNNKGQKLFNTDYNPELWKEAVETAKAVIDYAEASSKIKLTYAKDNVDDDPSVYDDADVIRGLKNLDEMFIRNAAPEEYIWGISKSGIGWRRCATPGNIMNEVQGWIGLCPTYKLVDAFAMADGVYPVKTEHWISADYKNGKNVDEHLDVDDRAVDAGYAETGSVQMANPLFIATDFNMEENPAKEMATPKRLAGREARFYRNIGWSGMQYMMGDGTISSDDGAIEFYTNGKHGNGNANDVSASGFVGLKFYDPTLNVYQNGWGAFTYPIFRLAGVYLDYIEALNETDPSHADILKYWNMIRDRAGVPPIEQVYPDIKGNQELQREFIRRERMVELCFEGHRLFDCRTWMIAEQTNNGHVIGCKMKATTDAVDSEYWSRVEITMAEHGYGEGQVMSPRKFTKKSYLFMFPIAELNKVPSLRDSQNYGW